MVLRSKLYFCIAMSKISGRNIQVKGLVQGVGFRPFIYRLAGEHDIKGWVVNRNDGVIISAEGTNENLDVFIDNISKKAPEASSIHRIMVNESTLSGHKDFTIRKSDDHSDEITEISPDIAVCHQCLGDMESQDHRIDYPFINCTNCGPRFTIIRDLPYDREKTTMAPFIMCDRCRSEYTEILDRRFHAQPVACNHCGPHYTLRSEGRSITGTLKISEEVSRLIALGKIIAIKGLGGYHLACDALNENAARRLRDRKLRDGKPFAVMFRDMEALRQFQEADQYEEKAVSSWRRPIVILKNKQGGPSLAPDISVGFKTTGCMLPYMPIHYLLFKKLETPVIVLTSGNISDEPVIIDDREAQDKLGAVADAILSYNREIHNRADDSVEMYFDGTVQMVRRSRGYVPSPVRLTLDTEGIIGAGAELVNCFCVGKGREAIMSQHIGDLKNLETLEFYSEALERFQRMFRSEPGLIVHDLHPDYLSTRYALNQKNKGVSLLAVQHHHAHIASCMAEHQLDEKVIGISFDGVGLGEDGHVWGGEFMIADLTGYERAFNFSYVPMPGGDIATKHPWRMAVSYLLKAYKGRLPDPLPGFLDEIDPAHLQIVIQSIRKNINAPLTSSAGRLFDAIAALTGTCTHASFHAEAPMRLESIAGEGIPEEYPYDVTGKEIVFDRMIRAITDDLIKGVDRGVISAKFHNTVIRTITDTAEKLKDQTGISTVAFSGGSFQNRIISENATRKLRNLGFRVFTQRAVPANDGGIALGQLAIGAKKRSLGLLNK